MDIIFESQITNIILTLLAAALGGFIFFKFGIPAGSLLGAMFFVMIISIFWGNCFIPKCMITAVRISAGTFIGCRILRSSLLSLKKIFAPMLFFVFFMIILSIFSGFVIYNTSGIHKATAFFACAPGGLTDMSLISEEFGSDMSNVVLLQFIRVIGCMTFIPFVVKRIGRRKTKNNNYSCKKIISLDLQSCEYKSCTNKTINFFFTILIGFIGGFIGLTMSIPAGEMIGAFIFVAFFNIFVFRLSMPEKIKRGIQILIGAVVGSGMTMDNVLGLKNLIVPAVMVAIFLLTIGIFIGFLLNKIWNIDINTALVATSPGGLTEMSLIASDVGADVSVVTSLHFARILAVIIIYPIIIKLVI